MCVIACVSVCIDSDVKNPGMYCVSVQIKYEKVVMYVCVCAQKKGV